ncbi:ATP-binding cassette domain-containing protein [Caenispirillum bisanense]|uniref:ATP-binding cassette domain-containing protein n=1 Tax=Caenispirillum bisanense TaxID=414052 RepID=UPI0031E40C71
MTVRTPTVLQHEMTECGLAALAMLMGYHGCHVPLHELRTVAGASRDGTSLRRLRDLARHYGFLAHAVSCEPEALAGRPLPLMAFVSFNHMVVVEGITPHWVQVNDPAVGPMRMDRADFDRMFTGVALAVTPGPQVRPRRPWRARSAILRRAAVAAAPWTAAVVAGEAGVMAVATLMAGELWPAALALPPLLAATLAAGRHLSRRLDECIGSDSLSTLLGRSPASIAHRSPSLLQAIADSGQRVGRDILAPVTVDAARLAASAVPGVTLALMHPVAGAATVAGAVACGALAAVATAARGSIRRRAEAVAGDDLPDLPLAVPLRLPSYLFDGRDDDLLAEIAGSRAEHSATLARAVTAAAWHRGATVGLAAAAVAVAGATGGGPAFALAALALWPWLGVGQLARRLLHLRREAALLADIEAAPPADQPTSSTATPGVLELSAVRFGYSTAAPPLLDGLTLRLEAGAQVGLTGPVGAGKSTLAAIAAGQVLPWDGTATRGGTLALVTERPILVQASLRDAVTLWDHGISDAAVQEALRAVRLWEELSDRPGGLHQPVEAHGRNLSGGQRRRLGIARALVRRPDILIIDEALDGVDLEAETLLRRHLRRHGITLLLISQREESLAACDAVWHLGDGRLTATGAAVVSQDCGPAPQPAPPPPPPTPAEAEERAGLERLLAALGLPPPLEADTRTEGGLAGLRHAARRSGVVLRHVRLTGDAWRHNSLEPLLVRHAALGWTPLLPGRNGRYSLVLADGSRRPLTDADASAVAEDAIAAHRRPLPEQPALDRPRPALPSAASSLLLCLGTGLLVPGLPLAAGVLGAAAVALGAAAGDLGAGRRRAIGMAVGEIQLAGHALRLQPAWVQARHPDHLAAWSEAAGRLLAGQTQRAMPAAALSARQAADDTLAALVGALPDLRGNGGLNRVVEHWQRQKQAADEAARAPLRRLAWAEAAVRGATLAGLALTAVAPVAAPVLAAAWLLAHAGRQSLNHRRQWRRVGPFLSGPVEDAGAAPAAFDATLTAEDLHFRYRADGPPVLDGASLQVAAGEVVAVVGPSGAGKSTLIAILLGLLAPERGTVRLGGHSLRDSDRTVLRAACDALFQDEPLPGMTLRSYLLGSTPHDAAAAWSALAAVGLDGEVARWPMGLYTPLDPRGMSAGQILQVRLARVLLRRPGLLVLDEATAALDAGVQALILAELRRRRITTLLTAHRADTLSLVDHAWRLQDGRLLPITLPCAPPAPPPSATAPAAHPAPPRIYRRAALDRHDGSAILDRVTTLPRVAPFR